MSVIQNLLAYQRSNPKILSWKLFLLLLVAVSTTEPCNTHVLVLASLGMRSLIFLIQYHLMIFKWICGYEVNKSARAMQKAGYDNIGRNPIGSSFTFKNSLPFVGNMKKYIHLK